MKNETEQNVVLGQINFVITVFSFRKRFLRDNEFLQGNRFAREMPVSKPLFRLADDCLEILELNRDFFVVLVV